MNNDKSENRMRDALNSVHVTVEGKTEASGYAEGVFNALRDSGVLAKVFDGEVESRDESMKAASGPTPFLLSPIELIGRHAHALKTDFGFPPSPARCSIKNASISGAYSQGMDVQYLGGPTTKE